MKTKVFLLSLLAVVFAACEDKFDSAPDGKSTSDKVVTNSATKVTKTSALLTGEVGLELAGYKSIEFGMLISESEFEVLEYQGERLEGDILIGQTFSIEVTDLVAETKYYYRAYLILNGIQYEYGAVKSFTTETDGGGYIPGTGGKENGYDYVDLGLSVKWATCNVGATTPEGYGDYFAWGETSKKNRYSSDHYYIYFSDVILPLEYDAAHVNWGGNWRMPTHDEFDELKNNCTWVWTTQHGVNGYNVVGTNGNSIFLPAAGSYCGYDLDFLGTSGLYWSSSRSASGENYIDYLEFNSYNIHIVWDFGFFGESVRAVCP